MAIQDDFSVAVNGDIRHVSGTATYTVLELHRFLQDYADDASEAGDDFMSIIRDTPSDRSTDNIITLLNGYNIDDTAAEFLYDGSIIQAGGATIYDGIVNFGNATHIELVQNGALIANDFWNLGGSGLNANAAAGISHRFLVKTRDASADIDGRRLLGLSREFGYTYSEFGINGTARGNNVLALSEATDLNNQTSAGTVATWIDIANETEGYIAIDTSGDGNAEPYYSEWDRGSRTVSQLYERAKWLTRRGSAETLYGLSGGLFRGITHEIAVDTPTGTWFESEAISWTGGTGRMLAIDSPTAPTTLWIQLLTGTLPSDNATLTGGTSGATALVNVTVTERPISTPFIGASTGSAIIGAYGVGFQAGDLGASDTVFDLSNTAVNPPNNVNFAVLGLVSGEDRVLVGPGSAGALDVTQYALAATLSGAAVSAIVLSAPFAADTPSSGVIRVVDNAGRHRRLPYSSTNGTDTFNLTTPEDFSTTNASAANGVYQAYIDELATATSSNFSVVYNADRELFIRVRDGGGTPIRTFETSATLGNANGSVTAIRTSDA